MRWRGVTGVVLLWTLYFSLICKVSCSGVFDLHLTSFHNDRGLNADGHCCNGRKINNSCTSTCRTFFHICLTHFQAKIAETTSTCTFAQSTTPVLGANSMDFSKQLPVVDFTNPIRFPFKFSWPGTFSLIIEAWHDSTLKEPSPGSPRELISRLAVQRSANVADQWSSFNRTWAFKDFQYRYRVSCDEHYYGAGCSVLCRPRDDQFGHYTCSDNGTKVCNSGWQGPYCDQAICLPGCHPDHGVCGKPSECKCRLGWQGKNCDQCMPYPGCKNGTCSKPWQCNCDEGWGGLFCNQDLNYCTHHTPCLNAGTCQNTGKGSFTCACPPGFTGTKCEVEIDDCASQPCLNGGTCEDFGSSFRCTCPAGYHGPLCQVMGTTCTDNKCMNGGTCVIENDNHKCLCISGYTGPNCEIEANECLSSPCKNGGHCLDELGGFRCICDSGFQGPTCEENTDDCTNNPCMNGATCLDQTNSYACRCVPGFVGRHCETNVDDCQLHPCANGGTCFDLVNDFECNCAPGFAGKDCRDNINECGSNPCENGATCQDLVADYRCACTMGFWGKNCQYRDGETPKPTTEAPITEKTTTQIWEEPPVDANNKSSIAENVPSEEGLNMQEWALVVCFGAGIPLIIIIIVVLILLLKRRRQSAQQDNMHKEREQNDVNNMNNKCVETNIFTTIPPSSSGIKVTNEEQDFNTFKQKHNYLEKTSNHKQLIKDLNTKEQFPRKDFEQPPLKIPDFERVSTEGSSHSNSEYQQDRLFVKSIHKQDANPNSILILEPPVRLPQYRDGVLATEV